MTENSWGIYKKEPHTTSCFGEVSWFRATRQKVWSRDLGWKGFALLVFQWGSIRQFQGTKRKQKFFYFKALSEVLKSTYIYLYTYIFIYDPHCSTHCIRLTHVPEAAFTLELQDHKTHLIIQSNKYGSCPFSPLSLHTPVRSHAPNMLLPQMYRIVF